MQLKTAFDHKGTNIGLAVGVTPEDAEKWLGHNDHNRAIKPRIVSQYRRQMESGAWNFQGDPLRFADDGTLLDGQHRLTAQVLADVTLDYVVIMGVGSDKQLTMDIGATRSYADHLRILGIHNSTICASLVRWSHIWQGDGMVTDPNTRPTMGELEKTRLKLDADEVQFWARYANRLTRTIQNTPVTMLGAFGMYAAGLPDADEDAEVFMGRLAGEIACGENDPAFLLRKRLQSEAMTRGAPVPQRLVLGLTARAWNAYREGRQISRLMFRVGGARPDAIPELV